MYTYTSISSITAGGTAKTVVLPALNWGVDWGISTKPEHRKSERKWMINNTTAMGLQESASVLMNTVSNVYQNGPFEATMWNRTRKGVKLIQDLHTAYIKTDSTGTESDVILPIDVTITVKSITDYGMPTDIIQDAILRAVGMWFETADTTMEGRIDRMSRGILLPTGVV